MRNLIYIPDFIMLVGLPGSGKSSFVERHKDKFGNYIVHSSDEIRKELFGNVNENSQENNKKVFDLLHKRVKEDLLAGKNVIYDACNISSKRRMRFINEELKRISCAKTCNVVAVPFDICVNRDKEREKKVGRDVIYKMFTNFIVPQYYEGWDTINIEYNYEVNEIREKIDNDIFFLYAQLFMIEHDNPHHSVNIGEHCCECLNYLVNNSHTNTNLLCAAMLHDIGKYYTKSFINLKGEVSDVAHYYKHENVSAYMALFHLRYLIKEDFLSNQTLDIISLIQNHMKMYNLSEKKQLKLKKQIDEENYNLLELLHEADKAAH